MTNDNLKSEVFKTIEQLTDEYVSTLDNEAMTDSGSTLKDEAEVVINDFLAYIYEKTDSAQEKHKLIDKLNEEIGQLRLSLRTFEI